MFYLDKSKVIIMATATIFLGYVAYTKFSLPLDTVNFSPDVLYRGSIEAKVLDPKEYYRNLNGLTISTNLDDNCDISVISENKAIKLTTVEGNYLPLVYTGKETDYSKIIGVDGSSMFTDKQEIVMPVSNTKFKNSNLKDSSLGDSSGNHNIEIISGDKILIVFEDVMTWWCHAHNPAGTIKHDSKIGYGSSIESIRGGAILGVAKNSTKIKVYKIRDEVFSATHKISDVSKMSEMQQINAGEYLINGKVKIL